MHGTTRTSRWWWVRSAVGAVLGLAVIALLLMWLMGAFHEKVPAGAPEHVLSRAAADAAIHEVKTTETPVLETVVGTVEASERIRVGSRILARVKRVHVEAGQRVKTGDLLVELDDADLRAALAEARAAVDAAVAAREQARTDLDRSVQLLERNVVSEDRVERDRTNLKRAEAAAERAAEAVKRGEASLSYATIHAPSGGIVIERLVEAGNLAKPGVDVVTLYDPAKLQLVASVREALGAKMRPGDPVTVYVDALHHSCEANIARIVPEAKQQSRSFQVEVTGPCPEGVMSGMFGRLIVETGKRTTIFVPRRAVRSVGQLDQVRLVLADRTILRRFVRTGAARGDEVEILSGLRDGDRILLDATPAGR